MTKRNKWIYKILWFVFYAVLMGALPALGFASPTLQTAAKGEKAESSAAMEAAPQANSTKKKPGFLLYDEADGTTFFVSEEEYMLYAAICEMPASYEKEALKAQAVAARTYALYCRAQRKNGAPVLTVNTAKYEGFCRKEDLKALWGAHTEAYFHTFQEAVKEVKDDAVLYRGKPILAAYFACSAGKTEDSALVWGGALPYLKPVEMGADLLAKDSRKTVKLQKKELEKAIRSFDSGIALAEKPEEWIGKPVYSKSGTVLSLRVGNRTVSGQQMRKIAGLPSACFSVRVQDGVFLFSTRGRGHGVGLSQNGANELAKAGMNYKEILQYFYRDTEIDAYFQ